MYPATAAKLAGISEGHAMNIMRNRVEKPDEKMKQKLISVLKACPVCHRAWKEKGDEPTGRRRRTQKE